MEILRALGVLIEPPVESHGPVAAALDLGEIPDKADYTDLFQFQLPPFASTYLSPDGLQGGETADRIAGFRRALGEEPPPEADHLASLLAFLAALEETEADAESEVDKRGWRHARRALLGEHLLSWLPFYLDKLGSLAPSYYRRWARALEEALAHLVAELEPPDVLPLHLRAEMALVDPREAGGETFLRSLLVPLRSGFLLVGSDLELAARELRLGRRIGERAFALRALLSQDAAATLDWLARAAHEAGRRHGASKLALPRIRDSWSHRAAASAELLAELSRSAS